MWFALGWRQTELNEDQDVMEWTEEVAKLMYQALIDSNFDLESAEFYLDITSYGTGILFEEAESEDPKKWKGLDFQSAPVRDCYFEMDHKNQVLRFYRQYQWTPMQVIDKFGDKTPDWIVEKAESTDSNDTKIKLIFCVFTRMDKKDNIDTDKVLAADQRPYGWSWTIHKDGSSIGDGGGYYEMPAFIGRWRKTSGSQWGYSPAHICLSDILTLNELTEETLEALGKVVDPSTITTERNLMSDLDIGRGGLTVVKDIDGLKAFESRARFDVGELKTDRLQESIRRAYRIDQFQLKDSPAMTAEEVRARENQSQRLTGPTYGRLKNDFLDKCINRTFKIMFRAGQFPPLPEAVKELKGEFDIEYVGPLPRAQRQEVVQATNMYMGGIAGLVELWPELKDLPDTDKIGRETAKMSGLPANFLRSKAEVDNLRKNREEAMAEAQQVEMERAKGEAMTSQGEGMDAMGGAMNNMTGASNEG